MKNMPRYFISAGHSLSDPGYVCGCGLYPEAQWNMLIRDELKLLLPEAYFVPDNFSLRETIDWINSYADSDSFALEIHLNSNKSPLYRGTEAYYTDTPRYAEIFSRKISEVLGIPNRGPKHDSLTFVGSLGFLRQVKCPNVLIEACYLTNLEDRKALENGGPKKIAEGIKNSLDALFLVPVQLKEAQRQVSYLWELLERLKRKLNI